jgi:ribonuclease-3
LTQKDYSQFAETQLHYTFNDISHLVTALTHRSYINEHRKSADEHNERLEFLGDAVLELVVTEHLYSQYDEPEGILTNWRSALVRTESIGAAAERLHFDTVMRLSRGERQGGDRARQQILANAFEAVIGAIYMDGGYEPAKAFIEANILSTLNKILDDGTWRDAKSRLQEIAQSIDNETPTYKVMQEDGPDHDKTFVVGVFIGSQMKGQGMGHSKQSAQQKAAEEAMQHYAKIQGKQD